MVEVKVANVVGTSTYQQELALDALAETFSQRDEILELEYNPAENHWLPVAFRVFKTGVKPVMAT